MFCGPTEHITSWMSRTNSRSGCRVKLPGGVVLPGSPSRSMAPDLYSGSASSRGFESLSGLLLYLVGSMDLTGIWCNLATRVLWEHESRFESDFPDFYWSRPRDALSASLWRHIQNFLLRASRFCPLLSCAVQIISGWWPAGGYECGFLGCVVLRSTWTCG